MAWEQFFFESWGIRKETIKLLTSYKPPLLAAAKSTQCIYSFIQHKFLKSPLCFRYCFRCRRNSSLKTMKKKNLALIN